MIGSQAVMTSSAAPSRMILTMIFSFIFSLLRFKKLVQALPNDGPDGCYFLSRESPDSPENFRINPDRKHLFGFAHIPFSFQRLWESVLRSTIVSRLDLYVREVNWVIENLLPPVRPPSSGPGSRVFSVFSSERAFVFLPGRKIFSSKGKNGGGAFCFCLSGGRRQTPHQEGVCSSTPPVSEDMYLLNLAYASGYLAYVSGTSLMRQATLLMCQATLLSLVHARY